MRSSPKRGTEFLAQAGVVAALYTALTLLIQPISYGILQFRVSELLCILPAFLPAAIPGLSVGCLLANAVGLASGANPAGGWDLLFGTAATALAAWLTYRLRGVRFRGIPVVATLPPVICNGLVVGTELFWLFGNVPWLVCVAWVALGEAVTAVAGGCLLALALQRFPLFR